MGMGMVTRTDKTTSLIIRAFRTTNKGMDMMDTNKTTNKATNRRRTSLNTILAT